MYTPHIKVKVNVFYANNYHPLRTEEEDIVLSVFSTVYFQRNETKRTVVDGHPFWIRYEYPKVDILYDNSTKDLLASINISDDTTDFEIRETQLNDLGYCFTVDIEKEVEPTSLSQDAYDDFLKKDSTRDLVEHNDSKKYSFALNNYRNMCMFYDLCEKEHLSETTIGLIKDYLDNIDISKINSDDEYTVDGVSNITFKFFRSYQDGDVSVEAFVEHTTDRRQEQLDFESTINYYGRHDLMYITMGYCPEDDYTLSEEVHCDDHLIYEDRTNNDDTLVDIKIFDFKSISIDKLKEQYNDCSYPYWNNLKNYQNTLKENPHESTN